MPLRSQDAKLEGLKCITTLDPCGANGVLLKSNQTKRWLYADTLDMLLERCNRFRMRNACGNNLSPSTIENSRCKVDNPSLKWFLNVCIALSARFALCLLGGIIWYFMLFFFIASCNSKDVSLSRIHMLDETLLHLSQLSKTFQTCVMVAAYLFFNGVPRIEFISTWYWHTQL